MLSAEPPVTPRRRSFRPDAEGSSPIIVGQSFSVRIDGAAVPLRAVDVRDSFPAAPAGEPFVVVSSQQLSQLTQGFVPEPTSVLVRAPGLSLASVQADVERPAGPGRCRPGSDRVVHPQCTRRRRRCRSGS